MPWNPTMSNLRDVLAALYFELPDARRIVADAGIPASHVAWDQKPVNNWQNILEEADRRGHKYVRDIIAIARKQYPENVWLALAEQGELKEEKGPDIREQIVWKGVTEEDQLEKIIGKRSTLLPIHFLEVGLLRSKPVCRILRSDGVAGSGFLIQGNNIVTNHHVLSAPNPAASAKVQFNYQQSQDGCDFVCDEYSLAPEKLFWTTKEADLSIVRIDGVPSERWGEIEVRGASVKPGDHVNIVQHPGGGPKQIAMYHNTVVYADEERVQYLTDTLPGSSGSPVFDQDWNLVAVHYSGGWLREPGTKEFFFRNAGIHVTQLVRALQAAGIAPQ